MFVCNAVPCSGRQVKPGEVDMQMRQKYSSKVYCKVVWCSNVSDK